VVTTFCSTTVALIEVWFANIWPWDANLLQKYEIETWMGSDVWVDDSASITCGLKVSYASIVGLGAAVTKNIEPYSVNIANPTKKLRSPFTDEEVSDLRDLELWEMDLNEPDGVTFSNISGSTSTLSNRKLRHSRF